MISSELRDIVRQYIDSSVTAEELEEWLVPRLPQYIAEPSSENAEIVSTIELGLSEMEAGFRTEEEFKSMLKETLNDQTGIIIYYPPQNEFSSISSGTSSHTSTLGITTEIVNSFEMINC